MKFLQVTRKTLTNLLKSLNKTTILDKQQNINKVESGLAKSM